MNARLRRAVLGLTLATVITTAAACSTSKPAATGTVPTSNRPAIPADANTTIDPSAGVVQGMLNGAAKGGIALAVGTAGARYSTSAGTDGRFVLRLPPGRYRISGRSFPLYSDGRIDCAAAQRVVVTGGTTQSLNLWCAPR